MGLLDEAIREHLELKRRSGADPGDIAREEQEALDPVLADEPSTWGAPETTGEVVLEGGLPIDEASLEEPPAPVAPERGEDFSRLGQETAELDMSRVLDEEDHPSEHRGEGPGPIRPASAGAERDAGVEGAFEWELPGRSAHEPPPAEIPGQERLSFE